MPAKPKTSAKKSAAVRRPRSRDWVEFYPDEVEAALRSIRRRYGYEDFEKVTLSTLRSVAWLLPNDVMREALKSLRGLVLTQSEMAQLPKSAAGRRYLCYDLSKRGVRMRRDSSAAEIAAAARQY